MPQATELERFAQTLIQLVRDEAIEACDRLLSPGAVGPTAKHWAAVAPGADARRALLELIPDIVDQTLFRVLDAADNDELPLAWRKADGSSVSLSELGLGEMAGWLMMGSDGWRARYSSQRFFDPFSDLRLR